MLSAQPKKEKQQRPLSLKYKREARPEEGNKGACR